MIAAFLLLFTQAPAQLTPESLVAHPGLAEGRYAQVREDHLQALEANPNSRWAYAAVQAMSLLGPLCAEGIDPERLLKLADEVNDGQAQQAITQLIEHELDRRRFSSNPVAITRDLHADFFDDWWTLGPYGRLDEPAALWGDVDTAAPHHQLLDEYRSAAGQALRWTPVSRPRGSAGVLPEIELYPSSGGTAYLLAWVTAPVEEALLEIWSERPLQIHWNGKLVHEELRIGLTQSNHRVTVPVQLAPEGNGLLLRFENGPNSIIGARLLHLDGRRLDSPASTSNERAVRSWPKTDAVARVSPETSDEPFASCVEMLIAISKNRCDSALAVPEPSSPAELPAWLRLRYHAVRSSSHLPAEVDRRFQQNIERRLDALGVSYPEIEMFRAYRLLEEDQPHLALEISDRLVAAHPLVPLFRLQRMGTLSVIDQSHIASRKAARETLQILDDSDSWAALASAATQRADTAAAIDYLARAAAADGSKEHPGLLLNLLSGGTEEQLERALRMIEHWRVDQPYALWLDDTERNVLGRLGRPERVEELLVQRAALRPSHPSNWTLLADHYLREGQDEAARKTLHRVLEITPGNRWALGALEQLGEADPAESFFQEFGPDRAAALAAAPSASGASTALVLDSRLVYVRPDNSTRARTHQITLALDRTGTELLHEQPDQGETKVTCVLGADGKIFEPVLVNGTWVMPSLDPGDAVERVFDESMSGFPDAAPQLGIWMFESFDQPFLISRYVVYVPDGTPGRWDTESFTGTHEEISWGDGVVHVFEMRDRPRLEPEVASVSARELLSWVEYGDDIETHFAAQSLASSLAWRQDVADDVALELRELVATVSSEHPRNELPRALWDAVTEHVIDFGGGGDTTDIWYLQRGNPAGLLAALYDIAGISYRWAVPFPSSPPELDPEPRRAFLTPGDFGIPWLRLENEEGEITWLFVPPGGRGYPFGRVPEELGGTRLLVLGHDGSSFEKLPPTSEDRWQHELEIDLHVQDDKSARVSVHYIMSDANGPLSREAVSQLEPQQREQALRQLATQIVPGIEVESLELRNMRERGADFDLAFAGTLKRFVRGTSSNAYCKLTWPQHQLGRYTGEGERRWPFALRSHRTDKALIRIHGSDMWQVGNPPDSKSADRDGFHYEVQFEIGENLLTARKELRIHGLELSAENLAPFAREIKELEDLDTARIPLSPKN